ncbi:MAG: hypothetical protein ACRCW9_00950 [Cetobacterium sp.]
MKDDQYKTIDELIYLISISNDIKLKKDILSRILITIEDNEADFPSDQATALKGHNKFSIRKKNRLVFRNNDGYYYEIEGNAGTHEFLSEQNKSLKTIIEKQNNMFDKLLTMLTNIETALVPLAGGAPINTVDITQARLTLEEIKTEKENLTSLGNDITL